MRFEALPGSTLPSDLQALGYTVMPTGTTMRVIPHATTEIIAGARSSMPPERIVHHAGIMQTNVYEIDRAAMDAAARVGA